MDEKEIKQEMRLYAIEHLLGLLYLRAYMQSPDPMAPAIRYGR